MDCNDKSWLNSAGTELPELGHLCALQSIFWDRSNRVEVKMTLGRVLKSMEESEMLLLLLSGGCRKPFLFPPARHLLSDDFTKPYGGL